MRWWRISGILRLNNSKLMYVTLWTTTYFTRWVTDPTTGGASNADSLPTVTVLENGVAMAYSPTVSSIATWLYLVSVDATAWNGFEASKIYTLYMTATVWWVTGRNWIWTFEVITYSMETIMSRIDVAISSRATVNWVWDEHLTGATHNVPNSAGRRLRQLAYLAIHDGVAQGSGTGDNQIQLDTWASSSNGTYDPSEIAIIAGTGAWQSRLILQYVGATRTATVDRNWRVKPDATSEFIIYVNSGREHVNEGLAQGGSSNTITLNANASSTDDAYVWQTIFLRSGTWEDQVASVTAYNGTTKVATIYTSMAWNIWSVTPDSTTGYVMLPQHSISSGGGWWLTEAQASHLMKLRNGGGWGAIIDGKSIEDFLKKWNAPLIRTIEKLPEEIKTKLDEKISEENTLAEEKISHIIESKDQEIEKALSAVDGITKKTEGTIEEMKTIAIQIKQNSERFTHSLEVKELEKDIQEETKWLKEAHEKKVDDEVKSLETEIQIEEELQKLAKEAQIQEEIKTLESNF